MPEDSDVPSDSSSLASLLPDFDGPGTPFAFAETPWGPAFGVPLREPLPDHEGGLVMTLVAKETTGTVDLDQAVDTSVPSAFESSASDRPAHAAAIRHALSAALFHLKMYVDIEASVMIRMRQDGVTPPGGAATEHFDPRLVFTAESSVLQMRAALDAVARALVYEGMKGSTSYGKSGAGLKRWRDPRSAELLRLVQAFRPKLSELERVRNFIAHPNPSPTTPAFGSFTLLPYMRNHTCAWIAPPLYERQRTKDVLVGLEGSTREHVKDLLGVLWVR